MSAQMVESARTKERRRFVVVVLGEKCRFKENRPRFRRSDLWWVAPLKDASTADQSGVRQPNRRPE